MDSTTHISWFCSSLIFLAALLSVSDSPITGRITISICSGTSWDGARQCLITRMRAWHPAQWSLLFRHPFIDRGHQGPHLPYQWRDLNTHYIQHETLSSPAAFAIKWHLKHQMEKQQQVIGPNGLKARYGPPHQKCHIWYKTSFRLI